MCIQHEIDIEKWKFKLRKNNSYSELKIYIKKIEIDIEDYKLILRKSKLILRNIKLEMRIGKLILRKVKLIMRCWKFTTENEHLNWKIKKLYWEMKNL